MRLFVKMYCSHGDQTTLQCACCVASRQLYSAMPYNVDAVENGTHTKQLSLSMKTRLICIQNVHKMCVCFYIRVVNIFAFNVFVIRTYQLQRKLQLIS
mmetsp:Transcript_14519/g.19353  ORF Transcript_14519/g.19353 Transcript_14519/m.19353 type:complete len:98 (-) Transcript_14519:714-1007(-)